MPPQEIDADGTWTVTVLPGGIKDRQLTTPSPAYLAAQAVIVNAPKHRGADERLAALLAEIASATTIADLKTRVATNPILQGP